MLLLGHIFSLLLAFFLGCAVPEESPSHRDIKNEQKKTARSQAAELLTKAAKQSEEVVQNQKDLRIKLDKYDQNIKEVTIEGIQQLFSLVKGYPNKHLKPLNNLSKNSEQSIKNIIEKFFILRSVPSSESLDVFSQQELSAFSTKLSECVRSILKK